MLQTFAPAAEMRARVPKEKETISERRYAARKRNLMCSFSGGRNGFLLWWSEWLSQQSSCVKRAASLSFCAANAEVYSQARAALCEPLVWRCHLALCLMQTLLKRVQQVESAKDLVHRECQNAFWHWSASKQKHPQLHRT